MSVCDKIGKQICDNTLEFVRDYINTKTREQLVSTKDLYIAVQDFIRNEMVSNKTDNIKLWTAFPLSVSINNCVSNYIHNPEYPIFNTIKDGDVVKYQFGVTVKNKVKEPATYYIVGDTLVVGDKTDAHNKYLTVLEKLVKRVLKNMKAGNVTDDVKIAVESYCAEHDCFPVENTMSFQQLDGELETEESKYMVLNFKKYYDNDGYLTVQPNTNFELEENEVYTIDLSIVPNTDTEHKYQNIPSQFYKFTNYFESLRLHSSRTFLSTMKGKYQNNVFSSIDIENLESKQKLGMIECISKGVLRQVNCRMLKSNTPIYSMQFVVRVGKEYGEKLT